VVKDASLVQTLAAWSQVKSLATIADPKRVWRDVSAAQSAVVVHRVMVLVEVLV
jgi:hypothetical protein